MAIDPEDLLIDHTKFDDPGARTFVDLIDSFKAYLAKEAEDDYGVEQVTRHIDTTWPIGLVSFCDPHIGNRGVAYDVLLRDIETWVKEPGLYVMDMGDEVDNVLPKSKGGHDGQLMRPRTQWRALDMLLAMLKDKLIAVAASNHPWRTETAAGIDKVAELCEKHQIPYLPNGGLINLYVGEQYYDIGAWHLFTGESKINKGNAFRRAFDEGNQPKIVLLADAHDAYMETSWRGRKRSLRLRGSTYKTRDGFVRRYGSRTADPAVTMPMAILWPDRDHWIGFDDYRDGLIMLRALRAQYGA